MLAVVTDPISNGENGGYPVELRSPIMLLFKNNSTEGHHAYEYAVSLRSLTPTPRRPTAMSRCVPQHIVGV